MEGEPTERDRIIQTVREELTFPQVGRVDRVFEHTTSDDVSNHEADVIIPPGTDQSEPRRVPIAQPSTGEIRVPDSDDLVLVQYLRGDGDRPIITGHVYADADDDRAPLGTAGDVRIRRGDLYAELAGDGTSARLAAKPGDTDPPEARIEIDDSGSSPVVRVTGGDPSDTGLELDLGTGAFKIGDGSQYGIESDGAGNFTWYMESLDMVTDGSTLSW